MKTIKTHKEFPRNAEDNIIRNQDYIREPVETIPLPNYSKDPVLNNELPGRIEVSRGCPFSCTYCSTSRFWGHKIEVISVERVIKEIIQLRELGFCDFKFTGDSFPVFSMKELFSFLEKSDISWGMSTRIEWLKENVLEQLKKAKCKYIYLGIESGSQKIIDLFNKKSDLTLVFDRIKQISDKGISPKVSFIIGHPEEKKDDLEKTLFLVARLATIKDIEIQIYILSPLKGTEIYNHYSDKIIFSKMSSISPTVGFKEEKELIREHPNLFSSFYMFKNKHISSDILETIQESYVLFVKTNPQWILKILEKGKSALNLFFEYLSWEEENCTYDLRKNELEQFTQIFFPRFVKNYELNENKHIINSQVQRKLLQ